MVIDSLRVEELYSLPLSVDIAQSLFIIIIIIIVHTNTVSAQQFNTIIHSPTYICKHDYVSIYIYTGI